MMQVFCLQNAKTVVDFFMTCVSDCAGKRTLSAALLYPVMFGSISVFIFPALAFCLFPKAEIPVFLNLCVVTLLCHGITGKIKSEA